MNDRPISTENRENVMDEQPRRQTLMSSLVNAYRTRRLLRYSVWLVILVAVFALLGFFVLPPVAKSVAISQASKALHRPVAIEDIRVNPFAMTLDVDGLSIKEREGEEVFVGFDHFHADLDAASLFKGGIVFSEIQLVNPQARIVRLKGGRFNFSDLVDEFANKPKTEEEQDSKFNFSLNNIQISGGKLVFDDRVVGEKHEAVDITLALPFVSNMEYAVQTFVEPAFSAVINGAALQAKGKSKPFTESMDSELVLDLSGVKVPGYLVYSPVKPPVRLASGTLDTALSIVFHNGQKASLQVSGTASLKNFDIRENDGGALAKFKKLDIALGKSDVLAQNFVVDRIALDAPEVNVRIDPQGRLNLTTLQAASSTPSQKAVQATEKPTKKLPAKKPRRQTRQRAVKGKAAATARQTPKAAPQTAEIPAQDAASAQARTEAPSDADSSLGQPAGVTAAAPREAGAEAAAGGTANADPATASTTDSTSQAASSEASRKASSPAQTLVWSLGELDMTNGLVHVLDESRGTPIKTQIGDFDLNLKHLDSKGAEPSELKTFFRLNGAGEIVVHGKVEPFNSAADLNVIIKSLDLLPLQPYFDSQLNIALTRGQLTADGTLQVRQTANKQAAAGKAGGSALEGKFAGQATLGNLRAVDKISSQDFLRWKSLYFGKVDVSFNPLSITVGEIALSDFFARVIVSPEGRLNLTQIVRQDGVAASPVPSPEVAAAQADAAANANKVENKGEGEASAPVPAKSANAAPLPPIRIDKITLQGGNVRFTDNFVKPNYTANLKKVGGNVTQLSSTPGTIASLELRGSYNNIAPLTISAKINPLLAKPYLDLQAEVKGVELTSLSTYAAKYAGYAIEKGKLSLTVNYKIENDELQAQNRVFIDQLTFGDTRSDSPDATSLPVKLAVSLLKNRNGEIDLDLPISGTLSDPEFSVGGLVVKVIVNLLTKAVTSPFALLGSLFDGGEEMSMVAFDPGRANISETMQKRLENLAKALADRPALKLEITAVVDPENDREGVKRASIERKVEALKQQDSEKDTEGETASVEVSAEEYPALLERVYRAEKFPKPRNMIGLTKSLPVAEMEKLMLAHTTVDDEDLQNLGKRRARRVRDWLIEHGVDAERIFLLPVKMEEGGRPETGAETKADEEKRQTDEADKGEEKAADEGKQKDKPAGNGRVEFSLK